MINKFAALLLIGMALPYQILDWYGGRHTCHTASGALGRHLSLQPTRGPGESSSSVSGRKQVLVHIELEKRSWCIAIITESTARRLGCRAYSHRDINNCRYAVPKATFTQTWVRVRVRVRVSVYGLSVTRTSFIRMANNEQFNSDVIYDVTYASWPEWIKLIQILLFTSHELHGNVARRNSQVTRTRISANGRHWNTCKLVLVGTRIRVLGLALVSRPIWTHP